ncbi:MAG: hypothetical protein KF708_15565 [Pirellulales bacterium]|nr:hypothetical protein [Pirellulales bacterium]
MHHELSPQSEQYLDQIVAGGLYPSKEAALEAAVEALPEKTEPSHFVPDDHLETVERGIESAHAGRLKPVTPEFWDALRQMARETAAENDSR